MVISGEVRGVLEREGGEEEEEEEWWQQAYLAVGTVTGNDAREARDQMRSHAIAVKTMRVYLASQQNTLR
jgi:hypothetical protein